MSASASEMITTGLCTNHDSRRRSPSSSKINQYTEIEVEGNENVNVNLNVQVTAHHEVEEGGDPSLISPRSILTSSSADTADSTSSGRRVYCKSKDSAITISKQISMAALPNSFKGFPVRVLARRADAINVAVKAVAIATARLNNSNAKDGERSTTNNTRMDLVCIPFFRETRNDICLHIIDLATIQQDAILTTNPPQTFHIGARTSITTLAGAIANAAREKASITLTSIGGEATFQSIRSVAVAREYLTGRHDGVDLFTKIEFIKISLDNNKYDETTAVQITCFLHAGTIHLTEETM